MVLASRTPRYGQDYKSVVVSVTPEEHTAAKIRSAQYGVSIAEVCRLALGDEALWKRAVKRKQAAKAKAED